MPACFICHDPVKSGFVLCSQCAKKLEPFTLPPDLSFFIDRLAEDIVLDDSICQCSMCSIGSCSSQVSGLVCRNAVKAWLLSRAGNYFKREKSA